MFVSPPDTRVAFHPRLLQPLIASDLLCIAVGFIISRRLSGLMPFSGDDDTQTLVKVAKADWDFDDDCFEELSEDAKDFIEGLLVKDPR